MLVLEERCVGDGALDDGDVGAFLQEPVHDAPPDPAPPARHEGGLVLQFHVRAWANSMSVARVAVDSSE